MSMRRQHFRRTVLALALAGLVVLTAQSSRADNDEFYPGLQDLAGDGFGGTFGGASQSGISYAKRAKQWFRSPDGMVTFMPGVQDDPSSPPGIRRYGIKARVVFVSPTGAPENYGYMAPMTVRSVGFGLMPVEATVQVSQRRKNGYPVPVETFVWFNDYRDASAPGGYSKSVAEDTVVETFFNVRILKVKVDGVDVGLTGDCRTVEPAPVTMTGPGYTIDEPYRTPFTIRDWVIAHDPATFFHPTLGGQLNGTITIPAFTGCTTKMGDDMSGLMTLSVSGPDNPVSARAGVLCAVDRGWPLAPGMSSPKLTEGIAEGAQGVQYCNGTKTFDYPERP